MVLNISLFTKLHLPIVGHKIPYFVPNGAAAVVISQIFGSIIFEIYILLSYRAFRSPDFAKNAYQYFWLTISYSPGTRHTFNPSHHHHLLTLFFFFFFSSRQSIQVTLDSGTLALGPCTSGELPNSPS